MIHPSTLADREGAVRSRIRFSRLKSLANSSIQTGQVYESVADWDGETQVEAYHSVLKCKGRLCSGMEIQMMPTFPDSVVDNTTLSANVRYVLC